MPEADPEDVRELLNYRDAFEYVSFYLNSGGPITERLILEIHARLVAGVRGGPQRPGSTDSCRTLSSTLQQAKRSTRHPRLGRYLC